MIIRPTPRVSAILVAALAGLISASSLAAVSTILPDWSKAGYKGGQALPTGGTMIAMTSYGVTANDSVDDSNAIQSVIDQIRAATLKANGAVVSETNRECRHRSNIATTLTCERRWFASRPRSAMS